MSKKSKTHCIGILTSGGDCPGLNAAIRAIAKAAINDYGIKVLGVQDGFRGLVENRVIPLDNENTSGILTRGGTILGTSRDKPHKMLIGGKMMDMTGAAVENLKKHQVDCLVCLGGGGTQKNAMRLMKEGINVLTLPKTIDNDIVETEATFGFDTALGIATEAIDRLHTTATSHHRVIVCEIMGHGTGWLTLGAGISGGADVILVPEIPYNLHSIADFLSARRRTGKRFSIIALAEGARSVEEAKKALLEEEEKISKKEAKEGKEAKEAKKEEKKKHKDKEKKNEKNGDGKNKTKEESEAWYDETRENMPVVVKKIESEVVAYHVVQEPTASRVARHIQELAGVEARVTSLGHVQRGGIPSAFDRLLCSLLGAKAAELLADGVYNVMVGYQTGKCVPVPLEKVAGFRKLVTLDHPWVKTARLVDTCFGD
ncbi:MAG: ATP-dependent 6-phosphofructokinase [Candidatus Riflebacteria bacterium]|nr:ATP-dependent 6-phosphofructokinase [Candidatus Riflebacteria bacterium]